MWSIFKYILQNNPWYTTPYWLVKAFLYQIYKRTIRKPFAKTLFNGKNIIIFPFSTNTSAFMYTAIPDKAEMMVLRKLADKQTIFLDVGANIGEYCLMTLDKMQAVYAFEAHPATAKLCKMNFLLNGIDERYVINQAISDHQGQVTFSDLPDGSPVNQQLSDGEQGIEVAATTLDHFVASLDLHEETKLLIKIDVEGFEKAVLLGAKHILTTMPISGIILERFSDNFGEIKALLESWGYQIKPLSTNNVLCTPTASKTASLQNRTAYAATTIQC